MNLKKLLFMLTFFVLLGTTAFAQVQYYVDGVAGNDNWTGTAAAFSSGNVGPKQTIQAMVNAAANLDVINIAPATYNETVTLTSRVQLKPSGAINVTNLILNIASATQVELGSVAANALTVTGTLRLQSGNYKLTNAGQLVLASGGTYELYVSSSSTSSASSGFSTNVLSASAGAYTWKFLGAFTLDATEIPSAAPKDVLFNQSGTVVLPAAITCTGGNLTIASGAVVNLNGNDITVQGGTFTNNGSYFGAAAEEVNMTTAGTLITGSGTFQNLTLNQGGQTWKLGSNLTFSNVSQATASLINVAAGTLDFVNFNISTPGSVTIAGTIAYSGAGVASPGTLNFTGDLGTIGTVTFTVPGGGLTIQNLSITKPSGSTVTLAGGALIVDNQLNFTGGIFNIGALNLTLSNNHLGTAAIGGNINGSGGTFTIGGGASVNDIAISGAGQINVPFVVNATPKTITFSQLTTIGNNLTLTSGNMTTSSLQLINGLVSVAAGVLTFNTTNLSVTNTFTMTGGSLRGSSFITISGAFSQQNAAIVNMTGTLTMASYSTAGPGTGIFTAGTTTTTGAFNIGTGTGVYTINGNLVVGAGLTTNTGAVSVTGNTSSTTAALGGNLSTVNFSPSGALTFTAASVLTVTGNLTGGSTVDFTTATSAAITGNFSSVGTTTMGANPVTVGGNFTVTGAAADLIGAAGALTVTGTASIGRNVSVGAGDIDFQGAGSSTVGGSLITSATSPGVSVDLHFGGPVTISGNPGIQPAAGHAQEWRFDGAVTLTNATVKNIDLTTGAAAFTIDFYGNVTANDLLMTGAVVQTVNFREGTGLVSQLRNITITAGGSAAITTIAVGAATASKQHNLQVSGDITYGSNIAVITVNTNGKVVMNGSTGDLQTFANSQTITTPAVATLFTIANLEVANTQQDSDPLTNGTGAIPDATLASVNITLGAGSTFSVTNLTLTSNGIDGTNLLITDSGTITRSGGTLNIAGPGLGATGLSLVYTNQANINTGREYTVAAAADKIINMSLTGTGGKVTLTASSGNMTAGSLTVAAGRELAMSTFNVIVLTPTASGTYLTVNGTVSGTGILTYQPTNTNTYTIAGTTGSISNLTVNFGANGTVNMNSPVTLTGNLVTNGGTGTLVYGTAAPSTIGGNFTVNVATLTMNKTALAVTGNVIYTAGAGTLAGSLAVAGNYSQAAGNLTLSASNNIQVTGNYTSTGGTLTFPAASTSSFIVNGTTHATSGPTTYTFGVGATGRFVFSGSSAMTLNLGNNTTIPRLQLNDAAGLTMSGIAVTLTVNNLLLTSGTFTHNGLLTMPGATDRIIRDNGALASFSATGPAEVEYISTSSYNTSYEILNLMKKVIMNAASGNPTVTLDKNVTILTGGELNLSRGTLAIGSNALILQNTNTVTRAEGSLTGTPTYGTAITLQYFNTVADLTTGPEFTNDGSVTTLNVNAPGKQVILGANVKVGGTVNLLFGTLNLNGFTFTESGAGVTLTNNGNITGTGTLANTGAGNTFTGTTLSWPNLTNSGGLTINTTAATSATITVTAASVSITTGGVFTFGGGVHGTGGFTVTGAFSVSGTTAGAYTDAGKNTYFKGDFTKSGTSTLAQTAVFTFNGTSAQTITTNANFASTTINNTAGVTLGSDLTTANGSVFTFTAGRVTTGANTLTIGATGIGIIVGGSATSYVLGNLNRYSTTDASVADAGPATGRYAFPLGTSDGNYRPVTLVFTGAGPVNHIIRATHTNAQVTGTVGIPFTNGGVTINKLAPLYWTVSMYDATNTTFLAPFSNPTITLGAGGVQFGDLTLTRAVYRLTNQLNTWTIPGTPGVPYYDFNGVATIVHSGVQGWSTEPGELFAIGYASTFLIANPLTTQTLIVGGTAYIKNVTTAPAVFTGAMGAVTYSVTSSDPTKATAAITGAGVLTVTAVAEGTSTISVTATDINGEQLMSGFVATIQAKPTFTLPAAATFSIAEAAITSNTVVFAATGTAGITFAMVPNTPALAWAAFDAATKTLTLTPGYGVAGAVPGGVYTITIRATGTNLLTTDFVLTVTVTTTLRIPDWAASGALTTPTKTTNYNQQFILNYKAIDPDAHVITYSAVITPATTAAVFTNEAGLLLGKLIFTPTIANAGLTYTIVVTATCTAGLVSTTQTVITVNPNRAPTFVAPLLTSQTVPVVKVYGVTQAFTFQFAATDLDSDPYTFTLVSGLGTISSTGLYSWTPSGVGVVNTITVRLSDAVNPATFTDLTVVLTAASTITGVQYSDAIPDTYKLLQNFPNPFNPTTNIVFGLPKESNVTLRVFNILGQEVATLVNKVMPAGYHSVEFNASNLTSGLYIYRVEADNFVQVKKMLLMK